nr:histidine phosphatase family protein [uncultured Rhodoferax sp.]
MSLWVLRHARPLIAPGLCYGQLDMPADAGLTHTAALAAARVIPLHARLRYSPLQRCEQLAQALKGLRPDLALDCEADARLVEMGFGQHEGRPWAEIPQAAMQAWTDDFAGHRFGGAESVAEFMARVGQAWDGYRAAGAPDTVWVSHAGVARAAGLLAQGRHSVASAADWPVQGPGYGEWVCL